MYFEERFFRDWVQDTKGKLTVTSKRLFRATESMELTQYLLVTFSVPTGR